MSSSTRAPIPVSNRDMHDDIARQPCSVYERATRITPQERRTRGVVAMTCGMMVVELVVGFCSQSLALLADGWHMATHAGALGRRPWRIGLPVRVHASSALPLVLGK